MKIIFLTIFITALSITYSYGAQTKIDSIYNSLTLETRLKLLFADTLSQAEQVAPPPKTNSVVRTIGNGNKINGNNGFLLLLDAAHTNGNPSRYPAPTIQTLQNISDTVFLTKYYANLIRSHHNNGIHGVCIKLDDQSIALFCDSTQNNQLVPYRLRDFPKKLVSENIRSPQVNKSAFLIKSDNDDQNKEDESLETLLKGRNLFFSHNMESQITLFKRAIEQKMIDEALVERRVKELIAFQTAPPISDEPQKSVDYWRFELYRKSIVCLTQKHEPIVDFSNTEIGLYNNQTAKEHNLLELLKRYTENVLPSHPSILANAAFMKYFVVAAQSPQEIREAALSIKEIKRAFNNEVVLLFKGDRHDPIFQDSLIQQFNTLILGNGPDDLMFDLQTQALMGGIGVDQYKNTPAILKAAGFDAIGLQKNRLGYAPAENAGMNAQVLSQIDAIMAEMIRQKAAPGGQVLVARHGDVIYNKPFGKDSYSKGSPINQESIYDLASVTKVMGTTPLVMMLFDNGTLHTTTTLEEVLPPAQNTNKANITIQELLLHQAGLPAFIPFYLHALDSTQLHKPLYSKRFSREYPIRVDTRLFMLANATYKSTVFQPHPDSVFNIRVADNLFMNNHNKVEMLKKIYDEPLRKKEYRYSDLSLYLAQQVVEHQMGQPENILFDQYFSQPLGAKRLTFLPLEKFKPQEIVPTEFDQAFRRDLLRGYVHDPGAAMMGGVAGHAGLFANSHDLAKMAQMLLNKGSYGGKQYISPNTVDLFTRQQTEENRRGLGFDKPEPDKSKPGPCSDLATPSSYGHSGFTGTFIWIDPEKDLIYIFLSNRVHPYAYNKKLMEMSIRPKVQEVIYNAIME